MLKRKWLLFLLIFTIALIAFAKWYVFGLFFLGFPLSFVALFFGWTLAHSGPESFLYAFLLSLLPNYLLIVREALKEHIHLATRKEAV